MNVTADRTSISPAAGGPGAGRKPRGIRAAAGLAVALAAFSASPSSLGHAAASTSAAALTARTALAPLAPPATRAAETSADCPSSLGWQVTCSIVPE